MGCENNSMKLIEKIREGLDSVENGEKSAVFSFEFYPPRTRDGLDSLIETIERFVAHRPLFCDITWRSNGSSADLTPEIVNRMQNSVGVETMMHLTCTNMSVEKIDHALETIKSCGVRNVLALRGDPPKQSHETTASFAYALDLVKHIRSKYGDYFYIAVAGYPEGHPDVMGSDGVASQEVYEEDLTHLKRKVDAGANLIITQLFYDTDIFMKFVDDCHQIGITCPIVPGILPISNYKSFTKMTTLCKTKIPPEITSTLESIKDNEAAVKSYGIQLGTEMCRKILAHGIKTLHFYTMNKEESTLAILRNLGLIEDAQI